MGCKFGASSLNRPQSGRAHCDTVTEPVAILSLTRSTRNAILIIVNIRHGVWPLRCSPRPPLQADASRRTPNQRPTHTPPTCCSSDPPESESADHDASAQIRGSGCGPR
eukprot:2304058-Rhodomonas_salina.1